MDGKLVKEKLKKCGVSLSEIAARLGYENDQRLHSQLKSRDVKTGLLEDIARVIGVNMSFFYGDAAGAGLWFKMVARETCRVIPSFLPLRMRLLSCVTN